MGLGFGMFVFGCCGRFWVYRFGWLFFCGFCLLVVFVVLSVVCVL